MSRSEGKFKKIVGNSSMVTTNQHWHQDFQVSEDITSEVLLKQMLCASLDGVFVIDSNFRILHWSQSLKNLTGLSDSETVGTHLFESFPFLRKIGEEKVIRSALAGTAKTSSEHLFVCPSTKNRVFIDVYYFPLPGQNDEIIGVMGIVRDKCLVKPKNSINEIADNAGVLIRMSGPDSLWTYFNHSWLKFRGRQYHSELGVGWSEGIHPDDFQRYLETYMCNFNARTAFTIEYRLKRSDGVYRWLLDKAEPRFSAKGEFEGFVATAFDVTAYKEEQNKLGDAIRMREEFMAFASHELKSPLTSLNLQMNLLQMSIENLANGNSGAVRDILKIGERQLTKLNDLVEKLLDFARLSSGRMSFDFKKFDLSEMIGHICERFDLTSVTAGCSLEKQILPSVFINGDASRIDQVITNLLTNAAKYGAGKPVSIFLGKDEREAIIKVRDQGIGIAKEHQDRLFEKFFRCAPEEFGGLGLGLYITKKIVDGHRGIIGVHSEPEQGSEFFVKLPLVR